MRTCVLAFLASVGLVLCIPSYSDATLIRYDVIAGLDNLGNPFSGFIDVNENPYIATGISMPIEYEIEDFEFISAGGSNTGEQGTIRIVKSSDDAIVFAGDSSATFYGNYTWSSAGSGVLFTNDINDPYIFSLPSDPGHGHTSYYLTPPEYIYIINLNWDWPQPDEWRALGEFVLQLSIFYQSLKLSRTFFPL